MITQITPSNSPLTEGCPKDGVFSPSTCPSPSRGYPLPTIFSFFSLPVKHEMGCLANDLFTSHSSLIGILYARICFSSIFTSRYSLHLLLCERDDFLFLPPTFILPLRGGRERVGVFSPSFVKRGLGEILKIPLHPPFPKGEFFG
jgi:hypothetical protein